MDLHGTGRRAPGFVLASASPARADLLRQIGLRFEVLPSKIREDDIDSKGPIDKVVMLSQAKAKHTARSLIDKVIIAADTVVVLGDEILGSRRMKAKPLKCCLPYQAIGTMS